MREYIPGGFFLSNKKSNQETYGWQKNKAQGR